LKKVKIWNAFNGKVIKIYNNIMGNNEITSYTTDKILKKLYLGDNLGKIKSFNINKGTVLKEFHSHLGEIEEMIHSEKYHYLITLSNDGIVKIHTDKMLFETEVIKEIDLFQSTISTICISDDFSRLIIGLNTGNVKFFDVEHLRFDPDDIDNERDIIFIPININNFDMKNKIINNLLNLILIKRIDHKINMDSTRKDSKEKKLSNIKSNLKDKINWESNKKDIYDITKMNVDSALGYKKKYRIKHINAFDIDDEFDNKNKRKLSAGT
jgi:WD40 repeat protein